MTGSRGPDCTRTERIIDINEDQLRVIRTLPGTLLLIRRPAAHCGRPKRSGRPTPLPERLRRAGAEH
ncbi:hypothetical protein [Streptomyces sp. NPDC005407]|uniref:hypothetical protein n=1 Tax=Streptomyces sp. NPDC005407 TaxID=3155340 RepID=UPI0033A82E21